jgi:hypothetical protein
MIWPFAKSPARLRRRRTRDIWNVNAPLIRWSRKDAWTLNDSFAHVGIWGGTGAGKSTGSGRAIAHAFLRGGYGGIVFTAKSSERKLWEQYCKETGRSRDLICFGIHEPWRFNFLDFEMHRPGLGAGMTENVVNLFSTILEMAQRNTSQGGGREDEGYWRRAARQLSRNLVDLLSLSQGQLTISGLQKILMSLPMSLDEARSPQWRQGSYCFQCVCEAERRAKTPEQIRVLETIADYFLLEIPALSHRTRSVVMSTLSSMVDVLGRGVLRELFCDSVSNIDPTIVEDGYILVIDLPIKEFGEVGLFGQSIWKYAFQRSIERRNIRQSPRPVFLWADEAQFFVSSNDLEFLSTSRASRVSNVYLTQNIPNFYAALGGDKKGEAATDSIYGNLSLKVFHANGDPKTNQWASTLIGRTRQWFYNSNSNYQLPDGWSTLFGSGSGANTSAGMSESFEFEVQPSVFNTLRTGGREHRWNVDAVIFQSGRVFSDTGRPWRYATFSQKR